MRLTYQERMQIKAEKEAEKKAYNLIMKEKEQKQV